MTIQHLPMPVIDNFLNGDPCAIGPFRSDGEYLYLNNDAIAYRDKSGKVFRMQQPSATPPPKKPFFNRFISIFTWPFIASWFAVTIIFLLITNIF